MGTNSQSVATTNIFLTAYHVRGSIKVLLFLFTDKYFINYLTGDDDVINIGNVFSKRILCTQILYRPDDNVAYYR